MTKIQFYSLHHQARLLIWAMRDKGLSRWEASDLVCLLADLERCSMFIRSTTRICPPNRSLVERLQDFRENRKILLSRYQMNMEVFLGFAAKRLVD